MRYWKMIYYTNRSGEDYAVSEKIIDERMFRTIQRAYIDDREDIVFEDMIIKRKMIKEISPADDEVKEYKATGMFKYLGLPDVPMIEDKKDNGFIGIKNIILKKMEMLSPEKRTEAQEEASKEERRHKLYN